MMGIIDLVVPGISLCMAHSNSCIASKFSIQFMCQLETKISHRQGLIVELHLSIEGENMPDDISSLYSISEILKLSLTGAVQAKL